MVIWYILWPFGTFYGLLVTIWYIFPPVLVYCLEKNLATLVFLNIVLDHFLEFDIKKKPRTGEGIGSSFGVGRVENSFVEIRAKT
jgi:hypothetical protein